MASNSAATALAWQWVIEAMADLDQGNTSILKGLIDSSSNFLTEASETAKERVALRYLQERVGSPAGAPSHSCTLDSMDPTSSSEKVLCRYIREVTSLSNLEKDKADALGHEARSFILKRKANLPKTSLELLCESAIEGHALLKNHGGPIVSDYVDNRESNGADYVATKRRKLSTDDWSAQSEKNPSASLSPSNNHEILLENQGNVQHPLQQDILGSNKQCSVQQGIADFGGTDALLMKHNLNCQQPSQLNDGFHNDHFNDSENITNPPSCGHCAGTPNVVPETPNGGSDNDNIPQGSHPHTEMHYTENQQLSSVQKTSNHDTVTSKWTPSDGNDNDNVPRRSNPHTETCDSEKQQFPSTQKTSNHDIVTFKRTEKDLCAKCDKGGKLLTCSNSGCFISVHEVCLGTSANFDENGLFCCPFCSYARAFNTYRRAKRGFSQAGKALSVFLGKDQTSGLKKKSTASEILHKQAKVMASEGQGHSFCSDQFRKRQEGPDEQLQKIKAANTCTDDDFFRVNDEALTWGKRIDGPQNTGIDGQRSALKKLAYRGKSLCSRKKSHVTHTNSIEKHKGVSEGSGLVSNPDHICSTENAQFDDCNLPYDANKTFHLIGSSDDGIKSLGKNLIDKEPLHRKDASVEQKKVSSSNKPVDSSDKEAGEEQEKISANNGPINSSDENVPHFQENEGASEGNDECSEGKQRGATLDGNKLNDLDQHTDNLSPSKHKKKHKPSRRYSNPVVIQARRTKLLWSKEEEEMLKVTVKKFAVNDDGSYPWTKMLDFGRHVFHNTRKPGDLKDKWRNIRIKEGI